MRLFLDSILHAANVLLEKSDSDLENTHIQDCIRDADKAIWEAVNILEYEEKENQN